MYESYVLDKAYFVKVIEDLAAIVEEQRDYLTGLDSAIGDGDHGLNLSIGFREVSKNLSEWQKENLTILFKKIGMALLGKVGGSAGPLYGSLFMKMGEPAGGKDVVDFNEFCNMLKAGIEAVEMRGKAVVGEKTMVDALRPALDALTKAVEDGVAPKIAFEKMLDSAKAGRESTIPLIAKKGRAMRLGERAIGHVDPGSASSCIILEMFYKNMPQ
ncbi:dihydroxyacetone kinase subunit DhaL [Geosporobacter ferrireducens]|uniref:phosphoenolpyruvate--glycerone phosphotransferase n=1 Tax=Geosporobacter ferrireducens TaxID=1424294 RepID=A0A1D8GKA5_9FIRM|nr:dihydroxyacetone kinase subunit DhaL [Geosporobacter ferrireducens]AOT71292.1 dihydroxyacetone kinase subunit L [Geosporobacter ferrireducens]MTI58106.1 dihydroxyacetone kinase subunit L [Geosporobacter ferrireducens]